MKKILMVCLGNICRSPMAEGILKHKLKERNINWYVDSAGTAGYHIGEKPDRRAIEILKKHQIDISNLKGRQLSLSDFKTFDSIYVMDQSNYANTLSLANNEEETKKVEMIMNLVSPNQFISVPDPYFGGPEGFEKVFKMLNQACDAIINKHLSL